MMLAVAASGFSQKKMVSKAKSALIEPVDLVEAKTCIEAAMSNEETASDPATFVLAGKIYKKIFDAEAQKKILGQGYDEKSYKENLVNSVNSYINGAELSQIPDAKGKTNDKYNKEIKKAFAGLKGDLGAVGYALYKEKKYDDALKIFDGYISIPNCSIMREEPIDSTYYTIESLAAQSALLVKDNQKAIRYLYELKDANLPDGKMTYEWLVDALQAEKDTARSLKVLAEGLQKYPTDQYMISKQVNYYIQHGKRAEAISYLDNAIAANPTKPEYYNVKAGLYLMDKNYDEALKLYEKSQSIASNVEAVEGIGVVYAAQGVAEDGKADNIKSDAEWKKARAKAETIYKKAEGYLEQAKEMYGENYNSDNLYWLGIVYNRLREGEKYKAIQKIKNSL